MKINLLIIAGLLLTFSTQAQYLGLNASIFDATGEFNNNTSRNPVGLSINYVHAIGKSQRLLIGLETGVAMYTDFTYTVETPAGEELNIYEEDCFYNMHALVQYNLYQSPLAQLYAEGQMGYTSFFSSKTAEEVNPYFEDEFKWHGTSFNMGLGGGVRLNISGILRGEGSYHNRVWLDAGVTANTGSNTQYRSVTEEDQSLDEGNYESLTNYVHYRIGVKYFFGKKVRAEL
ncbi:MAG: hypothetical protein OCD76_06190 [Reichenbachiella sp.]